MKRIICLLISIILLLSCLSALAEMAETGTAAHTLVKRTVPLIIDSDIDESYTIPLYFLDGVEDLPYVDLNEYTDGLNT